MYATGRETEIAQLLENFLDDNKDYLPPIIFEDLNDLAAKIDDLVIRELEEKDDAIKELKEDNEDLKQTNGELMEQIEKLEGKLDDIQ